VRSSLLSVCLSHQAVDGLWNYITIQEVVYTLHQYLSARGQSALEPSQPDLNVTAAVASPSISEILLERCLRNAAILGETTYDSLLTMPSGPYKRNIVDDVTIAVVIIPTLPPLSSPK
jgi:hypothetical protein